MLRSLLFLILLFLFVIFSGCGEKETESQFEAHRISQEELGEKLYARFVGWRSLFQPRRQPWNIKDKYTISAPKMKKLNL